MIEVLLNKKVVARIARQHPEAERYNEGEPWILHHVGGGRIDRFPTLGTAFAEARKSWGDVLFRRMSSKKTGYSLRQIADELERTALGDGYFGNALRVAKDIPGLSVDEIQVLDRYATGLQRSTDHAALQDVAIRVREMVAEGMGEGCSSDGPKERRPRPKG